MNKALQTTLASMLVLTGGLAFAVTEVSWDQSTQPTSLADGAVKAAYDGSGSVTELTLDPAAAGDLKITGGNLTLSSSAAEVVTKSAGTTTIANALVQTGTAELPAELAFESDGEGWDSITLDTAQTAWTTVIKNMDISHLRNVTARFDKAAGQTTGGVPCDTVAYVSWSADHKVLRYEFQKYTSGATIRAVVIGFQQCGADIQMRHMYYAHIVDSKNIVGDERIGKMSIVYDENDNVRTGTTWGGYSYSKPQSNVNSGCFASNIVMALDVQAPLAVTELAGANALANVAVKVGKDSPATVIVKAKAAFPSAGAGSSVEVGAHGVLALNAAGSDISGLDHGIPIVVRAGGMLRLVLQTQLSAEASKVTLDGGVLWAGSSGMNNEPGHYIRNLTLRNGARVECDSMRVRNSSATWKVEGTSPSFYNTGISVWATNGKTEDVFNLDVADVTGDSKVDFTVAGPWTRPNHLGEGYRRCAVTKKGAGTMRIDGMVALGYRPFKLEAGTVIINGSLMQTNMVETAGLGGGNVDIHQDITLAGGTLALAANSTNNFGVVLTTGNAGGITVGADSEVNFADSSAQTWTAGAIAVIDFDPTTSKVRFGTDANGLTAAQLKQLRYQSATGPRYKFSLDADGYLTLTPPNGMVIMIK